LISKPIMAAMIFSGDCSLPKGFDTLDFDALTKLWQKVKHQLKNKDFLKKLQSLNIHRVKRDQIGQVIKLYENDPYMTVAWISRESGFSTHLFQWTNLIIEY